MVAACYATCCKNRGSKEMRARGVTFHSFPKDRKLCQAWVFNSRADKKWPNSLKHNSICSDHFLPQCFQSKRVDVAHHTLDILDESQKPTVSNMTKLHPTAVPTIFKDCQQMSARDIRMAKKNANEQGRPVGIGDLLLVPENIQEAEPLSQQNLVTQTNRGKGDERTSGNQKRNFVPVPECQEQKGVSAQLGSQVANCGNDQLPSPRSESCDFEAVASIPESDFILDHVLDADAVKGEKSGGSSQDSAGDAILVKRETVESDQTNQNNSSKNDERSWPIPQISSQVTMTFAPAIKIEFEGNSLQKKSKPKKLTKKQLLNLKQKEKGKKGRLMTLPVRKLFHDKPFLGEDPTEKKQPEIKPKPKKVIKLPLQFAMLEERHTVTKPFMFSNSKIKYPRGIRSGRLFQADPDPKAKGFLRVIDRDGFSVKKVHVQSLYFNNYTEWDLQPEQWHLVRKHQGDMNALTTHTLDHTYATLAPEELKKKEEMRTLEDFDKLIKVAEERKQRLEQYKNKLKFFQNETRRMKKQISRLTISLAKEKEKNGTGDTISRKCLQDHFEKLRQKKVKTQKVDVNVKKAAVKSGVRRRANERSEDDEGHSSKRVKRDSQVPSDDSDTDYDPELESDQGSESGDDEQNQNFMNCRPEDEDSRAVATIMKLEEKHLSVMEQSKEDREDDDDDFDNVESMESFEALGKMEWQVAHDDDGTGALSQTFVVPIEEKSTESTKSKPMDIIDYGDLDFEDVLIDGICSIPKTEKDS